VLFGRDCQYCCQAAGQRLSRADSCGMLAQRTRRHQTALDDLAASSAASDIPAASLRRTHRRWYARVPGQIWERGHGTERGRDPRPTSTFVLMPT